MEVLGGRFYEQVAEGLIVDPGSNPVPQATLADEVRGFESLHDLDMRYAVLTAGAATMKVMDGVVVPRNEETSGLRRDDIDRCHETAWGEVILRRFLPTQTGDVQGIGRRMVDIMQALNLQLQGFVLLGISPRVEAAETQTVQSLMTMGFLDYRWDIRETALRLRRCDALYAPFAMVVGGQVCCNNALAVGAAETRYNRDLQYSYRDKALQEFKMSLHRLNSILWTTLSAVDGTDFVLRLSRLRIVQQHRVNLPEAMDTRGGGGNITSVQVNGGGPGDARPVVVDNTDVLREIATLTGRVAGVHREVVNVQGEVGPIRADVAAAGPIIGAIRADVAQLVRDLAALGVRIPAVFPLVPPAVAIAAPPIPPIPAPPIPPIPAPAIPMAAAVPPPLPPIDYAPQFATLTGLITVIQAEVAANRTDVQRIQTDITALNGRVVTIDTNTQLAVGNIATLQTGLDTLRRDAQGYEQTIRADIANLATAMAAMGGNVTTELGRLYALIQGDFTTLHTLIQAESRALAAHLVAEFNRILTTSRLSVPTGTLIPRPGGGVTGPGGGGGGGMSSTAGPSAGDFLALITHLQASIDTNSAQLHDVETGIARIEQSSQAAFRIILSNSTQFAAVVTTLHALVQMNLPPVGGAGGPAAAAAAAAPGGGGAAAAVAAAAILPPAVAVDDGGGPPAPRRGRGVVDDPWGIPPYFPAAPALPGGALPSRAPQDQGI